MDHTFFFKDTLIRPAVDISQRETDEDALPFGLVGSLFVVFIVVNRIKFIVIHIVIVVVDFLAEVGM